MASYTVASGTFSVHDKALVANVADTVTFVDDVSKVEILSDGTAAIYVSLGSATAAVSGASTYKIPAGGPSTLTVSLADHPSNTINLISTATPTYSASSAA